ncbi:ParB N-terminal domain-containing protein [Halobacillus locisalis]|uniref:ParB N-terminal domain-containing protein n=1 Tax=Halobacillus locisalis TaxID=220753 RepID=A0A838CU05_9BACI|nr:ParB/RepB/Spo0J family partition protein [Halobacillus locisalis]MBA2175378.1 ParB N-terminal domain-containing protein [Halobacillus locisalis]
MDNNSSNHKWVEVYNVVPNPLNPRKDHSVKSEELQKIISNRGWEEGVTAYKQNQVYVILSGHRRWYAAREMGIKQIPLFIVERPKSKQEEVERIAALQQAKVDWTVYEWAKFTYECWLHYGKPPVWKLAEVVSFRKLTLQRYLRIIQYFDREEIEEGLEDRQLSIDTLTEIITWMKKCKKYNPQLTERLGESYIRQIMVKKALNKKVSRNTLSGDFFVENATEDQLMDFLVIAAKSLVQAQSEIQQQGKEESLSFNTVTRKMKYMVKDLNNIHPKSQKDWENYEKTVLNLESVLQEAKANMK